MIKVRAGTTTADAPAARVKNERREGAASLAFSCVVSLTELHILSNSLGFTEQMDRRLSAAARRPGPPTGATVSLFEREWLVLTGKAFFSDSSLPF